MNLKFKFWVYNYYNLNSKKKASLFIINLFNLSMIECIVYSKKRKYKKKIKKPGETMKGIRLF